MTPVKIGFVLMSNSRHPAPSTRIAVLNMLPFLRHADFEPHIVFEPVQDMEMPDVADLWPRLVAEGFRIVIFQKVHGPCVVRLARQLTAAGVRTAYVVCDLVDAEMVEATDTTIAVTEYLKNLHPVALQPKITVVHDGIENPEACKTSWAFHRGSRSRPLRAVLVTSFGLDHLPVLVSPPEWLEVTIVGRYAPAGETLQRLREARWKLASQQDMHKRLAYLKFLANPRIRCLAWDPAGVYEIMREADIGIIPIEKKSESESFTNWKVKSENRLTMKMCVGLPVIATPIPSYEPVIEQGRNGFLAHSLHDWSECLEKLRDPAIRREIGERARASVLERYSKQEQARRLIMALGSLLADSP